MGRTACTRRTRSARSGPRAAGCPWAPSGRRRSRIPGGTFRSDVAAMADARVATPDACCYRAVYLRRGRPLVVDGAAHVAEPRLREDWAVPTELDARALASALRLALADAWRADAARSTRSSRPLRASRSSCSRSARRRSCSRRRAARRSTRWSTRASPTALRGPMAARRAGPRRSPRPLRRCRSRRSPAWPSPRLVAASARGPPRSLRASGASARRRLAPGPRPRAHRGGRDAARGARVAGRGVGPRAGRLGGPHRAARCALRVAPGGLAERGVRRRGARSGRALVVSAHARPRSSRATWSANRGPAAPLSTAAEGARDGLGHEPWALHVRAVIQAFEHHRRHAKACGHEALRVRWEHRVGGESR